MQFLKYSGLLLLVLLFCGCAEVRLANGKYDVRLSGRDDCIMVYNDLIFLRLRNPEYETGDNGYWDWAGKYSIGEGNKIILDMKRQDKRIWKFYYELTMQGRTIVVEDFRSEKTFRLEHKSAFIPKNQNNLHDPNGVPANYPAYR